MVAYRIARIALAASVVGLFAAPAFAQDARFSYRAYELETPAGVSALLKRLERQAGAVCGTNIRQPLYASAAARACKEAYVRDIVGRIGDERLKAASTL